MAVKKKNTIRLQSTKSHHFYTINKSAMKDKGDNKGKLKLKKFDPVVREHVDYTEEKVKK